MDRLKRLLVENWTVDYGDGHVENVCVPHAWKQDVSVTFEGPVLYRTELEVPRRPSVLRFHGASYAADVRISGQPVAAHKGIWDAFDVDLRPFSGKRVSIEVSVVKNGGPTYPVRDVASGFLPYVFNTFGGIHGEVEVLDAGIEPPPLPPTRVQVDGHRIFVEGKPFYPRGLLTWGWYPEIGHTNPPVETIRAEVQAAKRVGFNLMKFCLWTPPHHYLKVLREEGMEAWLELPLWDPSSDPVKLQVIADEIERIVRQYRHHDNIICWTIGCELSQATPPEYRRRLVNLVKSLTGCPLVKDNSGSAEMYGGDLREFGDFDDFHPYCDLPFYPPVLDSLLPGPRPDRPVLLGEFNDIDVHRDLARLADDLPFWGSRMAELNDQGVRWLHEMPTILATNRFAQEPRANRHKELMESSRRKGIFIRKFVHESVRAREALAGYVVTGIRTTPISSAGFFDDWGEIRFTPEECLPWNGPDVLFQIPIRRPPWVHGGNRPGWLDPYNFFAGQVFIRIGIHSETGSRAGLIWTIRDEDGQVVAQGALEPMEIPALTSMQIGEISWTCDRAGSYRLDVEFGEAVNAWPINVFDCVTDAEKERWPVSELDPICRIGNLEIRTSEGTIPMPFWREAAYQFEGDAWGLPERWERFQAISPDRALDPGALPEDYEVVINRIDVRTYTEHPIAVRTKNGIVTTLRPFGGLGIQPAGLSRNPSGVELLRAMGI